MSISPKLGPRARNLAFSGSRQVVESLVEIVRSTDLRRISRTLRKFGANVYGAGAASTTGFLRVEVPADHLDDLAQISDVLYIEADDRY